MTVLGVFTCREAVRAVAKSFGHRLGAFQAKGNVHWADCVRCSARAVVVLTAEPQYRTTQVEVPCAKAAA